MNKIAVIGSRSFNNYQLMKETLDLIAKPGDIIISGGAAGADSLAEDYAEEKGLQKLIIYPAWRIYGKRAGLIRNEQMVNKCDQVVAFWNGNSNGTRHSINFAKIQNKPVTIVRF